MAAMFIADVRAAADRQDLGVGAHGFGITLHIQDVSDGLLKVEEGSLYPALHRLDRDKLLEAEWKISDNGRRARYYRLTAQGRKALAEQTETWDTLRTNTTAARPSPSTALCMMMVSLKPSIKA